MLDIKFVRANPDIVKENIKKKFQDEKLIEETEVDGRKRTYHLTSKGRSVYQEELDRLRQCVQDADEEELP